MLENLGSLSSLRQLSPLQANGIILVVVAGDVPAEVVVGIVVVLISVVAEVVVLVVVHSVVVVISLVAGVVVLVVVQSVVVVDEEVVVVAEAEDEVVVTVMMQEHAELTCEGSTGVPSPSLQFAYCVGTAAGSKLIAVVYVIQKALADEEYSGVLPSSALRQLF